LTDAEAMLTLERGWDKFQARVWDQVVQSSH
jgi:hypothetical protein